MKYTRNSSSQASVANPDSLFTTLTFPIVSSGAFSFSTTSPALGGGTYTMNTQIMTGTWLGSVLNFFGFGAYATQDVRTSLTTSFTAAAPNGFDILVASTTASMSTYLASSTISMAACGVSFDFNVTDCLNLLFVPQPQFIGQQLGALKNGFLSYAPWGYLTRTIVILSGQASSTLPTFTTTIALGSPTDTDTMTFDMGDMVSGGGTLLNSIKDTQTGTMSAQDIIEPWVRLFIALFVVIVIVRDLTHMGTSGRHNFAHGKNG
jgi:hypothetical protein